MTDDIILKCAYDDCSKTFIAQRHNQKYCTPECCKDATNKRIRSKYSETKQRLKGKKRICKTSRCGTILSRYTEEDICGKCISAIKASEQEFLRKKFRGV